MEEILKDRADFTARPIIEFRGVSKTYQTGTHALEDVNIRINSGEFVFVVGSSGAGKSTFMKLRNTGAASPAGGSPAADPPPRWRSR